MSSVLNKIVFGEKKPIPWKITISAFAISFFNAMILTVVFSFLPKFVKSIGTSEADTGYLVGLIAGSVFIGRLLCSFLWGLAADAYGKKRVLMITGFCLSLTTLAFGFSYNVNGAIISRVLQGMSMGVVVISKGIIMDICDDTNSSIGMTFLLGSYSFGCILGPVVGGFLAFPGELYPNSIFKSSIFNRFVILLPNLVVVIGLTVALISIFLFFPKDNKASSSNIRSTETLYNEQTHLIQASFLKSSSNRKFAFDIKITKFDQRKRLIKSKTSKFKESRYYRLLSNKNCMLLCVYYSIYSMYSMGFDECLPLYAATSKEYNGFGFTTSEIGILLMIVSSIVLVIEVSSMAKITQYFGLKKSFMYSNFVSCTSLLLLPLCQQILSNVVLFWIIVVVIVLVIRASISFSFLCLNVMLNNSVEPDLSGGANGLGVTASTIGRLIAVPTLGKMYSWSLRNIKNIDANRNALGFPFDQYFIFFLMSILAVITGVLTFALPETINRKVTSQTDNYIQ